MCVCVHAHMCVHGCTHVLNVKYVCANVCVRNWRGVGVEVELFTTEVKTEIILYIYLSVASF